MSKLRRSSTDKRLVSLTHNGRSFDVRLTNPQVSADGRDIHPDAQVIREMDVPRDREVIVRGWLVPSTFEVSGRDGLNVTFAIDASDPSGITPIVVTAVQISQAHRVEKTAKSIRALPYLEWDWSELPPIEVLRDAALILASVWVRIVIPSGNKRVSTEMSSAELATAITEWREWDKSARLEVVGLADAITRADLAHLRGQSHDLPPFDSAIALREVARLYEEAYRDGGRPNAPIEHYIANRTFRAVGTVRRQITMARERGFIVETRPPRRAIKASPKHKRGKSK